MPSGKIVSFRVSNEEAEMLNRKVALSGHTVGRHILLQKKCSLI